MRHTCEGNLLCESRRCMICLLRNGLSGWIDCPSERFPLTSTASSELSLVRLGQLCFSEEEERPFAAFAMRRGGSIAKFDESAEHARTESCAHFAAKYSLAAVKMTRCSRRSTGGRLQGLEFSIDLRALFLSGMTPWTRS